MKAHRFEQHFPGMPDDHWAEQPDGGARYCSYCGSVHPEDLAKSIREEGTVLEEADRKYGWPHKYYYSGGTLKAPGARKFYTVHLQDASEADKATIEKATSLSFHFAEECDRVSWRPFVVN